VFLALSLGITACDGEEPLELMPTMTGKDAGMDARMSPREASMPTPDARTDATPLPAEICPDEQFFTDELQPDLDNLCGRCHDSALDVTNSSLEVHSVNLPERTPAMIQENMQEVLRLIDFENPADSSFFRYHLDGGDDYGIPMADQIARFIGWIESARDNCDPPEPDAGMSGPSSFPCNAPVDTERFGTPESRDEWLRPGGVNELLVGDGPNNPGYCGGVLCHGSRDTGGDLWLARNEQMGNAECNLQVIEPFIDRGNVDTSNLLMWPLGENPIRPEQGRHGGSVVFQGRDDPNYVRLRAWIISGGIR